jgi:hypothetical protein
VLPLDHFRDLVDDADRLRACDPRHRNADGGASLRLNRGPERG